MINSMPWIGYTPANHRAVWMWLLELDTAMQGLTGGSEMSREFGGASPTWTSEAEYRPPFEEASKPASARVTCRASKNYARMRTINCSDA